MNFMYKRTSESSLYVLKMNPLYTLIDRGERLGAGHLLGRKILCDPRVCIGCCSFSVILGNTCAYLFLKWICCWRSHCQSRPLYSVSLYRVSGLVVLSEQGRVSGGFTKPPDTWPCLVVNATPRVFAVHQRHVLLVGYRVSSFRAVRSGQRAKTLCFFELR